MVGTDSSVTVIGDSMQVRGNLTGDEDLHVMGRIEGSIDLQRTMIVAESGIVKAEVQVRNAIISGVVVGNVSASAMSAIDNLFMKAYSCDGRTWLHTSHGSFRRRWNSNEARSL